MRRSPLKYQSNSGPTSSVSSAMKPSTDTTACMITVAMPGQTGLGARTHRSLVVRRAVPGQRVEPEVGLGVPPHRVCVVGVALGVVPLEEEPRTLDPVVVR